MTDVEIAEQLLTVESCKDIELECKDCPFNGIGGYCMSDGHGGVQLEKEFIQMWINEQ